MANIHTHTNKKISLKKENVRAGEMTQVKSTDYSSRGSEFNSQQLHGDSQPSVIGSDAPF